MTTFISYSRVHSEFVVRLARDLKAAGFDVWLDQLDIHKGARWDDAIEAAVERSSTFMIVLAPESIESQNVKDELSYAIDAGKNILPVVIKPCKIPLRLRRFQYVDFTDKPYKDSLADMKRLLSNTARLVKPPAAEPYYEEPVSAPVFEEPVIQRDPAPPLEPVKQAEPEKVSPLRKFIIPLVLAVIAVAGIIGVAASAANRNLPAAATLTFTVNPPTSASTDTLIPPQPQIIDKAGVAMRLVSAGDFTMGSDAGMADERPAHTVYLDTFYIDKYEVTNALFEACVQAGACQPPDNVSSSTRPDYYGESEFAQYPVLYADWNMAAAYCEWRGARLPTEAEWEKAARGTDGRTYPWGEDISCTEANYFGCQGDTAPVTRQEAGLSDYGVSNMAGNVSEWVSSLHMPYPYDPADGREDLDAAGPRVVRGGSWLNSDTDNEVRSARRQTADPSTASESIGFRCASTTVIPDTGPVAITETPANSSTASHVAATLRSEKTREAKDSTATSTPTPGGTRPPGSASLTPSRTATPNTPATTAIPPGPTTEVPPDPTTEVPPDPTTEVPPDPTTEVPPDPISEETGG